MIMAIPQETREKAVKMYLDGMASNDVGSELGVNGSSVLSWVRSMGFETRKRFEKTQAKEPTAKTFAVKQPTTPPAKGSINPLLQTLAGDDNLEPYIGKEILKMSPREIFAFLELLGVEGELVIRQKVKLKKHTPSLPWAQ